MGLSGHLNHGFFFSLNNIFIINIHYLNVNGNATKIKQNEIYIHMYVHV